MHDERERFLIRYSHSFASFTVARASGAWIETTDGQRILDFTSGQICSTIDHNHPRIVAAVQRSLDEVIHRNVLLLSLLLMPIDAQFATVMGPATAHVWKLVST